jgi:hypothetical protein
MGNVENNSSDIYKEEITKQKIERIKAEIKKLNSSFKNLDKNQKKICKSLIENAAFMAVSLEDLQTIINREGYVTEYKNGQNQFGTKKSPEVETYISMTKNYSAIIKQLTDLLPEKVEKTEDDGFDDFVKSRK